MADVDAPETNPPRRVVVLGLGGTIAMTRTSAGAAPALSVAQLLRAVPGLAETGIEIETIDIRQLPGASLSFADIAAVAAMLREQLAAGADGVVITQGTDTIEETSYLLDLGYRGSPPVVVTGAMRNPSLAGADGPANLLAAVQTAADPAARDLGVLVVFGDEIHAARRVRKTHTTSPATFQSTTGGPLGYLVEGRPHLLNRPTSRTVVPPPATARSPRVGLVTVTFDDDGELAASSAAGCDGLVLAAFGAGHVPATTVPIWQRLAARMPVVLASRTGAGSVLSATYGFPGSERDLLSRGLIRAGQLDAVKSRILLYALLSTTDDPALIDAAFGVAGGYRDPAGWPFPALS